MGALPAGHVVTAIEAHPAVDLFEQRFGGLDVALAVEQGPDLLAVGGGCLDATASEQTAVMLANLHFANA